MNNKFKTLISALLLSTVVATALVGCDEVQSTQSGATGDATATATATATVSSIPTVLTKDEAKPIFTKAFADTFGAKSITFNLNSKQEINVTSDGESDVNLSDEKLVGYVFLDENNATRSYVTEKNISTKREYSEESYYMDGKLYHYDGEDTWSSQREEPYDLNSIWNSNFVFDTTFDSFALSLFSDELTDAFTINERTVSIQLNDYEKCVRIFGGDSVSESQIEEALKMIKEFKFVISCSVGDDGYIKSVSCNYEMSIAREDMSAKQTMSFEMSFSQVNTTENKGVPSWLEEYFSDPRKFADSYSTDENGEIIQYGIYTYKNDQVVKETYYDGTGTLIYYIEYTYDDNNRVLTNIRYDPNGTLIEKYVCEYVDDENGELISFTESHYDEGGLISVRKENYALDTFEKIYYENGLISHKEDSEGNTTKYYYTGAGKLFCYETEERWGSVKYFDDKGNELTVNEYYERTYFDELGFDDKGRCIKKVEYNVNKEICGHLTLTYDENGNLIGELKTDSISHKVWEKTYYANGSLKEDIVYSAWGAISKNVKLYSEDGKLLTETLYESNGEFLIYYYNGNEIYNKIDRFGANTLIKYSADFDEKGRNIKETIYNTDGSLKNYNIREYYSETNFIITYYDADGNELRKDDSAYWGTGG